MDIQLTNAGRAEVLTQALPYMQKYYGKVVVIKYGGNAMINEQLKLQVMEDIVLLLKGCHNIHAIPKQQTCQEVFQERL